ncbi:hypothetical protein DFH07DRAFT_501499 [Mycena maculata]|uniref:Uncharacterized protein n=1 Tax=Mycena maculata TaxID=230809 RepID=A0AAD7J076_9AGAR|nr:hypothetical protein DFH07DRAFT_501499 [Mycena maculata]
MATENPAELKQVGRLFDGIVATIREDLDKVDSLEPLAIVWLKEARYQFMRTIEASYYELAHTRGKPLLLPRWINPAHQLLITTNEIPTVLWSYKEQFLDNLLSLAKDCGFTCTGFITISNTIMISISFPVTERVAGNTPRTLRVEDEFSRMGERTPQDGQSPGTFSVTDLSRLIEDARRGAPENVGGEPDDGKSGDVNAVDKLDDESQ